MQFITVGTAGHVDHGKTSLIKSLTGIDTDRLIEEKQRGLTIDLGFAFLPINTDFTVSFIDVPGHQKFLKNMLAGITGIDFVLLVIAANEGIMPQTIEHLQILKLLNIANGAIILTKTDLAETNILELVIEEIKETVRGSFLENSPVIKFSALSGQGSAEIINLFNNLNPEIAGKNNPEKKTGRKVVFPIDRVFTKSGFGTIVTGTLNSGLINTGDLLQLMPGGKNVKIKQIQVHNKNSSVVKTGTRAALNIPDVDTSDIRRGFTIISPGSFLLTDTIDVKLKIIKELKVDIKTNSRIKFYHFCSETSGRITFPGNKSISPGEEDFARIKLDKEIIVPHNSFFIIRNFSPHFLIGGGIVLNPYPTDKKVNAAGRRKILNYYNEKKYFEIAKDFLNENEKPSGKIFKAEEILEQLPHEICEEVFNYLINNSLIFSLSQNLYISSKFFNIKKEELLNIIKIFHENNPGKIGISRQEMQKELKVELFILENLLHILKETFIFKYENLYFFKDHKISISISEKKDIEKILFFLEKERFQNLKDLEITTKIDSNRLEGLLKILIFQNKIEELVEKVFVIKSTWLETVEKIKELLTKHGELTTSNAREQLKTSRKYIIPILETLDKQKITRRINDYRVFF